MDQLSVYTCSQVPSGHPSGLRWRETTPAGGLGLRLRLAAALRAATAVEAVLQPYEAHHQPRRAVAEPVATTS